MREISIALAQTSPVMNQVEQNVANMCQIVEDLCLRESVDLIVFPELATTGYDCGMRFADLAERVEDRSVQALAQRATEFNVHIAFGLAEQQKVESVVYSAAVLLDPDGKVVLDYQKVHLKGEQRLAFRPGYRLAVADTRLGRVGLMVGWDLAFPEVARSLALEGAELLCVCGAWEKPHAQEWRSYAFARAFENAVFVAACNRVGEEPTDAFFGESMVIAPRGQVAARIEGEEPSVMIATIDLDLVRQYQEDSQLLQSRQPRSYRKVVQMY